ncbi:glyoxalase superfamily protein [Phreatobacter sp.]|uniref:glyoxalase superfamily protein n=1 Tax=Phreatobacter sp. TaxID=1966341 RepID=UPI003F70CAD3
MRSFHNAKTMARTLREELAAQSLDISHSQALELVAHMFGFADWNTHAARIAAGEAEVDRSAGLHFKPAIPIIRSFDEAKAREFYLDFLGFAVDWEHRFHPGAPLYMQISRGDLLIHLSEHHGDASPGANCFCRVVGIEAFHAELIAKNYKNNRPGLERQDWGLEVTVHDPFGNRIRFCEQQHT